MACLLDLRTTLKSSMVKSPCTKGFSLIKSVVAVGGYSFAVKTNIILAKLFVADILLSS